MAIRVSIVGTTDTVTYPTWRDDELMAFQKDFLEEGYLSGLAVSERGAGTNLSVDVALGIAYIEITNTNLTPSKTYLVRAESDGTVNVPLATADLTNPRKDIIIMKFTPGDPNASSTNLTTIVVVTGTPAGSPTAPAVPANSLLLATVDVPALDTAITNGQITDGRVKVALDPSVLIDLARKTETQMNAQSDALNWLGTVSGTNTITASATPAIAAYAAGMRFSFIVAVTNTGPVTLNVNGVGAISVKRMDGTTALVAGDFVAGQLVMVQHDGTNFQMISPSGMNPGTVLTGTLIPWLTRTAPSGYLLANGAAVSRSTYSALYTLISPTVGAFTVTIATPAVFTLNSHGLVAGDAVYFTTTGALPTGLSANTLYYVIAAGLTANAFEVSATHPSIGSTAVNTTGSQSGIHTAVSCPYGLGDGSTTFNLPDLRGRIPQGDDKMGTSAASRIVDTVPALGITGGQEKAPHTHALSQTGISAGGGGAVVQTNITNSTNLNVMSPYITTYWIVKT